MSSGRRFQAAGALLRDPRSLTAMGFAAAALLAPSFPPAVAGFLVPMSWGGLVAVVVMGFYGAFENRRDSTGLWSDLAIAVLIWALADGLFVWSINRGHGTLAILAHLLGGVAWLAAWLGAARQPHRAGPWRPRSVERRLHLLGALVVGLGLGFYLVGAPAWDESWSVATRSAWLLLTVFGCLVTARFVVTAVQAPSVRWRWIYGTMGVACAVVTAGHIEATLRPEQPIPAQVGGAWSVIALALVALATLLDDVLADDAESREGLSDPIEEGPRGLETPYLGLAAAVPLAHFAAHRLDFLAPSLESHRELIMLGWSAALAAVAVFQQRRLEDWMRGILAEQRRLEGKLVGSRRRLQIAEQRRETEKALARAREKHAKAFRASSYAITLTSLEEGRLLDCNERFLEIVGHRRSEAVGCTVNELRVWADPAERSVLVEAMKKEGSVRGLHMSFRDSGGEVRQALVSAERLEVEGETCVMAVSRDLGDEAIERGWHGAAAPWIEQTPHALWRLNLEDRVLDANPAAQRLARLELDVQLNRPITQQSWMVDAAAFRGAAQRTSERGFWRGGLTIRHGGELELATRGRCWWSLVRDRQDLPVGKILMVGCDPR